MSTAETHAEHSVDEHAHGDALRFATPGGIPMELYWEVKKYVAPAEMASRLPSHPSRITPRGAAPRRFDHVTFIVDDVPAEQQFLTDVLGFFLVLPFTRPLARRGLVAFAKRYFVVLGPPGTPPPGMRPPGMRPPGTPPASGPGNRGDVIQGEVVDE